MIYLVEDDDSIRELVIYTLHSTGMDATGFSRSFKLISRIWFYWTSCFHFSTGTIGVQKSESSLVFRLYFFPPPLTI